DLDRVERASAAGEDAGAGLQRRVERGADRRLFVRGEEVPLHHPGAAMDDELPAVRVHVLLQYGPNARAPAPFRFAQQQRPPECKRGAQSIPLAQRSWYNYDIIILTGGYDDRPGPDGVRPPRASAVRGAAGGDDERLCDAPRPAS